MCLVCVSVVWSSTTYVIYMCHMCHTSVNCATPGATGVVVWLGCAIVFTIVPDQSSVVPHYSHMIYLHWSHDLSALVT